MLNISSGNTKAVPVIDEGGLKALDEYLPGAGPLKRRLNLTVKEKLR
jgi:hypothetical protein